jgi:hypothetical protein
MPHAQVVSRKFFSEKWEHFQRRLDFRSSEKSLKLLVSTWLSHKVSKSHLELHVSKIKHSDSQLLLPQVDLFHIFPSSTHVIFSLMYMKNLDVVFGPFLSHLTVVQLQTG